MYAFCHTLRSGPSVVAGGKCGVYLALIHENSSCHEVQLGEMTMFLKVDTHLEQQKLKYGESTVCLRVASAS